jgi:hypothetical protein
LEDALDDECPDDELLLLEELECPDDDDELLEELEDSSSSAAPLYATVTADQAALPPVNVADPA